MKTKIARTALVGLMMLMGLGCERPTSEKSQVAFQLPTYKNETALTCTKCLKAIIVNVNSENFKTIVFNQKMDKITEAGTQLTSEVVLDIPSGLARKIQILAIYLLPDSSTEVQYGSTLIDLLVAEPPPVTISLASLGLFKGGSIVGRYLTVGDSGPTGNVVISMNHAASGMNMDIGFGEIVNGWFDLFASETFPMSYRFESGTPIPEFQSITLNNLVPVTPFGGTAIPNRARIHRPSTYFVNRSSVWIPVNENHDIVYGFFGPSASVSNKKVCIEHQSAASAFLNLSSTNSGTSPLTFDEGNDTTASIYGIGGIDSAYDGACNTSVALYTKDVISITKMQFDGGGNDTARAKGGAFSYIADAGSIKKFNITGSAPLIYNFKALPGVFSGITTAAGFDGFKLFSKINATNGGFDNMKCFPLWLEIAGFAEVAVDSPTVLADVVRFSLPAGPLSTDGYILCPTKGGVLTGLGGFYIGSLFINPI